MNNVDFEKLKKIIIPYFVEIYGNEFESLIVDRINNIIPVFYSTVSGQKSQMYRMQKEEKFKLTLKFLEYNNIIIPDDIKKEAMQNYTTYTLKKVPGVESLLNLYFDTDSYTFGNSYYDVHELLFEPIDNKPSYKIDKSISKLKLLGISVTKETYNDWLMTDEAKELSRKIETVKNFILQLDDEYKKFDSQNDDLKSVIDKGTQIESVINEKNMVEFLKSIEKYMTNNDKEVLHNYLESPNKSLYQLKTDLNITKVVGGDFRYNGLIESFSEDSNKKLISDSVSDYTKKTIIEDRIKYYKLIGIYDGQIPAEEFIETTVAKQNIPKQEFIDDIILKKQHFKESATDELLVSLSNYNDCIEQLKSLDLLDLDPINQCLDIFKNKTMCINPSARMENGVPKLAPILFFSPENCLDNYVDVMFLHEVNHAIETVLLECTKDNIKCKTGFEILGNDNSERKYEQFSETTNQIIAMMVAEAMHRDGVYLFEKPENSKIIGGTSYEQQNIFVNDFFKQFKKDIMLARVSNDLSPLFNVVGQENFEALNNIINRYVQLPYYEMMNAIMNGKETEHTKEREALLKSSFAILNSMVEHANSMGLYQENKENVM